MAHGSTPVYNCPNCGLIWHTEAVQAGGHKVKTCGQCGSYCISPAHTADGAPVVHLLSRDEKALLQDETPHYLKDDEQ